jgi:hypothetical protein
MDRVLKKLTMVAENMQCDFKTLNIRSMPVALKSDVPP